MVRSEVPFAMPPGKVVAAFDTRCRRSGSLRRALRVGAATLAIAFCFRQGGGDGAFAVKVVPKKEPPKPPTAAEIKSGGPKDLLVVGCGHLGRRCATAWQAIHKDARVVGATLSTESHGKIWKLGVEPIKVDELNKRPDLKFPYVIYSPPPRGNDYVKETDDALVHWSGAGGFAITSANYVYSENAGGTVVEDSPTWQPPYPKTPNVEKKMDAEKKVFAAGGTVARISGLYDAGRGPHKYWFKTSKINNPKNSIMSLVHYEDAASGLVALLSKAAGKVAGGDVVNIDDGANLNTMEVNDAAARVIDTQPKPVFETVPGGDPFWQGQGKKVDAGKLRTKYGWKPKWESYGKFMASIKPYSATVPKPKPEAKPKA